MPTLKEGNSSLSINVNEYEEITSSQRQRDLTTIEELHLNVNQTLYSCDSMQNTHLAAIGCVYMEPNNQSLSNKGDPIGRVNRKPAANVTTFSEYDEVNDGACYDELHFSRDLGDEIETVPVSKICTK